MMPHGFDLDDEHLDEPPRVAWLLVAPVAAIAWVRDRILGLRAEACRADVMRRRGRVAP